MMENMNGYDDYKLGQMQSTMRKVSPKEGMKVCEETIEVPGVGTAKCIYVDGHIVVCSYDYGSL